MIHTGEIINLKIKKDYVNMSLEELRKENLTYDEQLKVMKKRTERFFKLSHSEKRKLDAEETLRFWKSPEFFEDINPNKNAFYRGRETKAFIEWKRQFETIDLKKD
jgi:hypothetical protein